MKYVLVIAIAGLLLFLLFLLLRKLRPYLIAGKQLLDTIRDFKSKISQTPNREIHSQKLVQCESCGTWVPSERMISVGSGKMFCSSTCVSRERGKLSR